MLAVEPAKFAGSTASFFRKFLIVLFLCEAMLWLFVKLYVIHPRSNVDYLAFGLL